LTVTNRQKIINHDLESAPQVAGIKSERRPASDRNTWPVTSEYADTLTLALEATVLNTVRVAHRPRLLSDNVSSYIAGELSECLNNSNIQHIRGAPNHPQTQGKIEWWHQTLKNWVLLENYYLPDDLRAQIKAFVHAYNNQRYQESLGT
jgi:transposase InsO family protein